MSNALEKSNRTKKDTKPSSRACRMLSETPKTAVVQLCFCRKPDCLGDRRLCLARWWLICFCKTFSKTFDKKGRMEIGLNSSPLEVLGTGTTLADFHCEGKMPVVNMQLKTWVKYGSSTGRTICKNNGCMSSPTAIDLMASILSSTSVGSTAIKQKAGQWAEKERFSDIWGIWWMSLVACEDINCWLSTLGFSPSRLRHLDLPMPLLRRFCHNNLPPTDALSRLEYVCALAARISRTTLLRSEQ